MAGQVQDLVVGLRVVERLQQFVAAGAALHAYVGPRECNAVPVALLAAYDVQLHLLVDAEVEVEADRQPVAGLVDQQVGHAHVVLQRDLLDHVAHAEEALPVQRRVVPAVDRSEEHTSELQSLMRLSYAVFCLKKKTTNTEKTLKK